MMLIFSLNKYFIKKGRDQLSIFKQMYMFFLCPDAASGQLGKCLERGEGVIPTQQPYNNFLLFFMSSFSGIFCKHWNLYLHLHFIDFQNQIKIPRIRVNSGTYIMMPLPLFISYLDDRKVKCTTNETKININSMT